MKEDNKTMDSFEYGTDSEMTLLEIRDEILSRGIDPLQDIIESDRNDKFILQYGNGVRITIENYNQH